MSLHFRCSLCGKRLKSPESMTGRKVKCGGCGQIMLVPRSAPPVAADPDAAVIAGLVPDAETTGPASYPDPATPARPTRWPMVAAFACGVFVGVVCTLIGFAGRPSGTAAVPPSVAVAREEVEKKPAQILPAKASANSPATAPAAAPAVAPAARRRQTQGEFLRPVVRPAPADVTRLSADKLYAAFRDNLADGDQKFLGKPVEVSGVPAELEKDARGRYFLKAYDDRVVIDRSPPQARVVGIEDLSRMAQAAALNTRYRHGIVLYVDPARVAEFANLRSGRSVTVGGVCRGTQRDERADPNFIVIVDSCRLVLP